MSFKETAMKMLFSGLATAAILLAGTVTQLYAGGQTWYISGDLSHITQDPTTSENWFQQYTWGYQWGAGPTTAACHFPAATWTGHVSFGSPYTGSVSFGVAKLDASSGWNITGMASQTFTGLSNATSLELTIPAPEFTIDAGGYFYFFWQSTSGSIGITIKQGGTNTYIITPAGADDFPNSGTSVSLPTKNHSSLQQLSLSAFPNPAKTTMTIIYTLPVATEVKADICTMDGKLVRTAFSGNCRKGYGKFFWDGRNMTGTPVRQGKYLFRIRTREGLRTAEIIEIMKR
jgi:hypothetical protein